MTYELENGALWIFFFDTPEGEGRVLGIAGVEVSSERQMHVTYHEYRGESLRMMSFQAELEVENADEWEIHFLEASSTDGQTSMILSF